VPPEQRRQIIQQLIDELVETLQRTIESGEVLSDELQGMIAQELQWLVSELESTGPTGGTPQPPPQIGQGNYPSSNINGFNYNPQTRELLIQFHGPYPQAAGPIYSYRGVPPHLYDVIYRGAVGPRTSGKNKYHRWQRGVTPSHGASVDALIKRGNYPYQRIA
jgi:hypothetical protein